MIKAAVTVLVLCAVLSCSDDTAVMAELDRAEAVMEEYPDSALALLKAVRSDEYDIVSLLTTVNGSSGRSSMHAIPQHLLEAQAASTGLPLMTVPLPANGGMDEYANAMRHAVEHFKVQGVSCFIFGDIFLHDVRLYRSVQLVLRNCWHYRPTKCRGENHHPF